MNQRTCLPICLVAALLCLAASNQAAAQTYVDGNNVASGNKGPVNQQFAYLGTNQNGNGNLASQYNNQQISGCDVSGVNQQSTIAGIKTNGNNNGAGATSSQSTSGRKLAGSVTASAVSSASATPGANQLYSAQQINQNGNGGYASTGTTGSIKCSGRKLLTV